MTNGFQVFACSEDKQCFQGLVSFFNLIYVLKFCQSPNVVPKTANKVELKYFLKIKKSKDVDVMTLVGA